MIQKYAAALLTIAITVITALVAIPEAQMSPVVVIQLVIFGLGSVLTYFLPLLSGRWAAGLKTGVNVLAAILTAAIPFVQNGSITSMQIIIVILAALNALAVQVGVNLRTDAPKHALA
jgi:hypothetical protein